MPDTDEATARLRQMIDGYQVSQAIAVMATLGIADALAGGAKPAPVIAQESGVHPGALTRLLRALATVGLLTNRGEDRFALTGMGHWLRTDVPDSLRNIAIHAGQPYMWSAWSQLLYSVQKGEPAFPHVHGMDVWDYRTRHPAAGRVFADAMTASSQEVAASLVRAYDFSSVQQVVDVGGGHGVLLAEILATHPSVSGLLVERADVVDRAREVLADAGVAERCNPMAGDFLDVVPTGGDVYVLKGVLHDWDDGGALRILANCWRAMAVGSTLLVIEQVVAEDGETDSFARFMDLHMLVIHGGGERTRDDFAGLLGRAGFALRRIIPTEVGLKILEAVPTELSAPGVTAESRV